MATEIERKFLVLDDTWRARVSHSEHLRQGYLNTPESCSVRVRRQSGSAWLNIKQAVMGRERLEFEYEIPAGDADEMLSRLAVGPLLEKTRHRVEHAGYEWEIDEFHGDNAGLLVAEIELAAADLEPPRPGWLGREVTHEARYYNVSLTRHPYAQWNEREKR